MKFLTTGDRYAYESGFLGSRCNVIAAELRHALNAIHGYDQNTQAAIRAISRALREAESPIDYGAFEPPCTALVLESSADAAHADAAADSAGEQLEQEKMEAVLGRPDRFDPV